LCIQIKYGNEKKNSEKMQADVNGARAISFICVEPFFYITGTNKNKNKIVTIVTIILSVRY
jgi:hypothetical protein